MRPPTVALRTAPEPGRLAAADRTPGLIIVMEPLLDMLRILVPVAYAVALTGYIGLFVREDPLARRIATPGLVVAVSLHALFVILRIAGLERQPIANTFESLTVIALAVACVHLYVETTHRNQGAGAFVIGVVLVFQVIASAFIGSAEVANPVLRSAWFGLHTGSAILGYSGFAVSAAYGLLFLLLYRELKASRFGRLYDRLPSLDVLALMTVRAAAVGLAFLTVAILLGIVWSARIAVDVWGDPKFIVTLVLWGVYGSCIGAHYLLGWAGRRVVYFSLVGFAIMIFSMALVNVLFRSFHSFAALAGSGAGAAV